MPPRLFHKFFLWYCHPRLRDHIEGDLLEEYNERLIRLGRRRANLYFILDVILLFRAKIIRPLEGITTLNTYGMYKNYIKIGWRNLRRQKTFSVINIGGLALGMAVGMLNALWIWHELSFNKYFSNYNDVAQVSEIGADPERGGSFLATSMTYPLGNSLLNEYKTNFERVARTSWQSDFILGVGDYKMSAIGFYADDDFPELLSIKMKVGAPSVADLKAVLISASAANALFGDEEAVNKSINLNGTEVVVRGVFEDFPDNTNFKNVRVLASWPLFLANNNWITERAEQDWRNHFIKIYVQVPSNTSIADVNDRVRSALKFDPADKEIAQKRNIQLYLYPMTDWHLYPPGLRTGSFEPVIALRLVGAIGIFVLILACINFMNLSTARAEKRAREVGIRKTVGSKRGQLVDQFYTETFLTVLFAFALAILLTTLFLPVFNDIATKQISMPWSNAYFWLAGLGFVLFTSVLAGSYPALYLSAFNPVQTLKGAWRPSSSGVLRKVLVVFQFSISIILIVATVIVYQQLQYAKNRPVGYDREGLLMIRKKTQEFYGKYEVLRNEWKNTGVVAEVSESMGPMTEVVSGNRGFDWDGRNPNNDVSFATLSVSHLHGKTAGWQFVAGRDFDISNPADSSSAVVNETAAKVMGMKDPIGQTVTWTWWSNGQKMQYRIIGVVRDLVMDSPYGHAEPTIFYLKGFNGTPEWINIRLAPNVSAHEALPKIERVFKKIITGAPFEYVFADEEYARKFGKEERTANIALFFAVLAIVISCLGLLGLASFVAEQKTKEIGIRKVLGASVSKLWSMLSREFVLLTLIACAVACPVAAYLMSKWLQKFPYRTDVSLSTYMLVALGALVITLVTVSYQAIRVALMNPTKSLRND